VDVVEVDLGNWIGQVGVGGIFLILVLKMVLEFVQKYKAKQDGQTVGTSGEHSILEKKLMVIMHKVEKIERQTDDLHTWHDKEDGDGRKIWYLSSSLTTAMDRLATSLDKQTQVLAEVAREQRQVIDGQRAMVEKLSKITGDLPRFASSSRG
jgi:hypothetical protein